MNIIDYKIVRAHSTTGVEGQVLASIKRDWQPIGGVTESSRGYSQAMVKYEDDGPADIDNPRPKPNLTPRHKDVGF